MNLRTKRRNRRHRRAYVLDVKLSATQRQAKRARRVTAFLSSTALLGSLAFLVWWGSDFLIRRYVRENPFFAIRTMQIETDGILSADQIRSWAGVKYNDNVMALDLGRIERDLKLVPAIESVVLERVLSRTLRLRVTEREPVAQVVVPPAGAGAASVEAGGTVYTLDGNGWCMFPIDSSQRALPATSTNEHLPLLLGVPLTEIHLGRQAESPQVRCALALVQAFGRSPMAGIVDLKQVQVGTPGTLVVTTAQGNEVIFGLNDLPAQLRRWRLVHDHAVRFGKHILSLDLAVANHSPLVWTDLSAITPPPPPKPLKLSRYKKHV